MAKDRIMAVGHRIRELRIRAGMTLDELATRVSEERGEPVHFTTIAKLERSQRTMSLDWIIAIASALHVQPADLLAEAETIPVTMVPLVGSIAAGNWREAILDPIGSVPVPNAGPNAFALKPVGDSMDKVTRDEAIIVVDPDQPDLLDGKLYAIMNAEGETTFKQYRADPPRLEPMSTNPQHATLPLGREPFKVIGRIVWEMVQR